jgi:hypothetical protein
MKDISYRARQEIPIRWFYIGEGRLHRKSVTHSGWQGEQVPLELSCSKHCS